MLDRIYTNPKNHLVVSLIVLLTSFILSLLAVFGAIFNQISYLVFLPISFIFFLAGLFSILILADPNNVSESKKVYFSIEFSAILFGILLIPMAILFV